jgi:hypothetical protein
MAHAATKVRCFKRTAGQNYIEMYTYKKWPDEQHSGVDVVHRYFPEGGDSILYVFSWEP